MAGTIKEHIKYTILSLKLLGLYPDSEHFFAGKLHVFHFFFVNVFILGLFNLSQVLYVITNLRDTESLLTHAYLVLTFIMPNVKHYFYIMHWKTIRKLYAQLDEEVFQPKNPRQVKLFDSFFKFPKFVHASYMSMVINITLLWAFIPMLSNSKRSLPYPYWLPFEYKAPIVFELVYCHQTLGMCIMTMSNMTMDMQTFGIMCYIATACDVLSDTLRNLFEFTRKKLEMNGFTTLDDEEGEMDVLVAEGAKDTLMDCIEFHWKILRFAADVNGYFRVMGFMQFGSSLLSLCLTMYGLNLITSPAELGICAIFMSGILTELGFFCFFGQEVTAKSGEITTALYHTPWVDCSHSFRKNVLFFMLRTQTPIKMLALNFFEMALPTFIWILRSSWSVYTVLARTTHKKEMDN